MPALITNNAPSLTNANATALFGSGTVPTAYEGSGTANAGSVLAGNQTWIPMTNLTAGSGLSISVGNLGLANSLLLLWTNNAVNLTNIPAAQITGTLPAINGAALTGLQVNGTTTSNSIATVAAAVDAAAGWVTAAVTNGLATLAYVQSATNLNTGTQGSNAVASVVTTVVNGSTPALNGAVVTNGVTNLSLTASSLAMTDANKTMTNVTLGTGLAFTGTTLKAAGGATAITNASPAVIPLSGAGTTNFLFSVWPTNTQAGTLPTNVYQCTLTANCQFPGPTNLTGQVSAPVDGQSIRVMFIQDATGNRTLSILTSSNSPPYVKFGTDITGITLSTNANAIDIASFQYQALWTNWLCTGFIRGLGGHDALTCNLNGFVPVSPGTDGCAQRRDRRIQRLDFRCVFCRLSNQCFDQ